MTPLLGFTKLLPKLLDGSKTQTIRKPRKRPFKVGDILYIYWKLRTPQCRKLGEAIVTSIVRKRFRQITEDDWILDGFSSSIEGIPAFTYMYPEYVSYNSIFDIITFEWIERVKA